MTCFVCGNDRSSCSSASCPSASALALAPAIEYTDKATTVAEYQRSHALEAGSNAIGAMELPVWTNWAKSPPPTDERVLVWNRAETDTLYIGYRDSCDDVESDEGMSICHHSFDYDFEFRNAVRAVWWAKVTLPTLDHDQRISLMNREELDEAQPHKDDADYREWKRNQDGDDDF